MHKFQCVRNNGNYHASETEKQELCGNLSPPLRVLFSPHQKLDRISFPCPHQIA